MSTSFMRRGKKNVAMQCAGLFLSAGKPMGSDHRSWQPHYGGHSTQKKAALRQP